MRRPLRRRVAWVLACAMLLPAGACPAQVSPRDLLRVPVKDVSDRSKRALVVGISNYIRVPALKYCVNDARKFATFLTNSWRFQDSSVVLMTDDQKDPRFQPTVRAIEDQIEEMMKGATADTEIVVFLSGHGLRQNGKDYLLPLDGVPGKVDRTCISITDLKLQLEQKNTRRALMFIDACREAPDGKTVDGNKFGSDTRLPNAPQLAVLYSCEPGQISREGKQNLQNGVFTHFLLDGLGGAKEAAIADGSITFDSLKDYVRAKVFAYVNKEYNSAQSPFGTSTFGAMVLAKTLIQVVDQNEGENRKLQAKALVDEAYALLNMGKPVNASEKALEALKLDADNANAHFILGQVYLVNEDPDMAVKELSRARELNQDLPGLMEQLAKAQDLKRKMQGGGGGTVVGGASAYLAEAETRLREKNYVQAEVLARFVLVAQADATTADRALAHAVLGRVYEAQGPQSYDKALKEFQEAVALQPGLEVAVQGAERLRMMTKKVDIAAKVNEALQLVQAGKLLDAELRAVEVLAQDPNNAKAHFVMGSVYSAQKQYDRAIVSFQRALDLDPTLGDARSGLMEAKARLEERRVATTAKKAYDALKQGSFSEAETLANQVLALKVQNEQANALSHLVLGTLFENQQKNADALRAYQEALRWEPGLNEARQGLDRVQKKIGETNIAALVDDAARALEQNDLAQAEAKARQATAQAPNNGRAHFVLGQVHFRNGRLEDAVQELLLARRIDQSLGVEPILKQIQDVKNQSEATRLASEAYRHFTNNEWAEAKDKARRAIQLNPESAQAHGVLGATLLELGDEKDGTASISEASRRDPDLAVVQVGEGLVRYRRFERLNGGLQGNWTANPASPELVDQAIQRFERALARDPREATALNNLGASYTIQAILFHAKGQENEFKARINSALDVYKRALAINNRNAVVHFNAGSAHLSLRSFAEAERSFREAIALNDQIGVFHARLATALWVQDKKTEAIESGKRALALKAPVDEIYDELKKALKIK